MSAQKLTYLLKAKGHKEDGEKVLSPLEPELRDHRGEARREDRA